MKFHLVGTTFLAQNLKKRGAGGRNWGGHKGEWEPLPNYGMTCAVQSWTKMHNLHLIKKSLHGNDLWDKKKYMRRKQTRVANLFSASTDVLLVRVYVKHNLGKILSAITWIKMLPLHIKETRMRHFWAHIRWDVSDYVRMLLCNISKLN